MGQLGNYLRNLRGSISLREFSKKCGISHTHLDSIEKGIDPRTGKPVRITTETLKNIATGLGVDFLALAALSEEMDYSSVQEKIKNDKNYRRAIISDEYPQCDDEIQTIAAHHEGEDWTEAELNEIEEFKKYVLSKRKK
ncbi:MAG: helix-turn-helix domain-containing protein [Aminipila sp.]